MGPSDLERRGPEAVSLTGGGAVAASQAVTTRPTSARLSAEQFSGRSSALCQ